MLINLGVGEGTVDKSVENSFLGNERRYFDENYRTATINLDKFNPNDPRFAASVQTASEMIKNIQNGKKYPPKVVAALQKFYNMGGMYQSEYGPLTADKTSGQGRGDSDFGGDYEEEEPSNTAKVTFPRLKLVLTQRERLGEEKWQKLLATYYKVPVTGLEAQRERFFRSTEFEFVEEAKSVADLKAFQHHRLDTTVVVRARLARDYEEKEAARRNREWDARGMIRLPRPTMKTSISPTPNSMGI